MPEEKVNRADYNKFGTIGALPAADAGPRQPMCKHCGKKVWLDTIPGRGWRHDNMRYECSQTVAEPAAPPAPQEAAPRPDCEMWSSPESSLAFDDELNPDDALATAPDEAMRVAEQKAFSIMWDEDCAQYRVNIPRYYGGKVVRLEDVAAALIRQAGSAREREAFESCAKELREHYNSDWDSTVPGAEFDAEILRILRKHLGEASRLLGGESCREK